MNHWRQFDCSKRLQCTSQRSAALTFIDGKMH